MSPSGFEPTIPEIERPQTHALDLASTGIGFASNTVLGIIFYELESVYLCILGHILVVVFTGFSSRNCPINPHNNIVLAALCDQR